MQQQIDIRQLLSLFGFNIDAFFIGKSISSQDEANVFAQEIKEDIKKRFHRMAIQYHPDKGGDAERFKELSNAYKFIQENFKIQIAPPQPQVVIIRHSNMYNDYYGGYSSATTSTCTGGW